jgi:hypothetical protein
MSNLIYDKTHPNKGETMSMTDKTSIIGHDNGYHSVKLCLGMNREFIIPSVVVPIDKSAKEAQPKANYEDETGAYLVGDDAINFGVKTPPNLDSTKYQTDAYRVQALYAFEKAKLTDVDVVTGVSMAYYKQNREGISNTMSSWAGKRRNLHVRRVRVLPEPMGTYMDQYLDWNGTVRNGLDKALGGIIDVGGNTVDLIEMSNGVYTQKKRGMNKGMFWTYEDLYDTLRNNQKYSDAVPSIYRMQELFEKKTLTLYGEKVNIEQIVKQAKSRLLAKINSAIKDMWGTTAQLEYLFLSGGGAPLLYEDLKANYRHLTMPENPVMANARGFYKYNLANRDFKG